MVKEDSISLTLSFGAGLIIVYLATIIGFPTELLIPAMLLAIGLVLQLYISGKIKHDTQLSGSEVEDIGKYTFLALIGFAVSSIMVPHLWRPVSQLSLSVTDRMLYGQLYAISEERFFRGAITTFLQWKIPYPMGVNILSGVVFAMYHLKVYGISEAFMYVLLAGVILTYVTLRSGRLTPAMLGHMINNIW